MDGSLIQQGKELSSEEVIQLGNKFPTIFGIERVFLRVLQKGLVHCIGNCKDVDGVDRRCHFYYLWGRPIHNVELRGIVIEVQQTPRKIRFLLDDGTGVINCELILAMSAATTSFEANEGDEHESQNFLTTSEWQRGSMKVGSFITVVGNLRWWGDETGSTELQIRVRTIHASRTRRYLPFTSDEVRTEEIEDGNQESLFILQTITALKKRYEQFTQNPIDVKPTT